MPIRRIAPSTRAGHLRVGIVLARFNPAIGDALLAGAERALSEAGVADSAITVGVVLMLLDVLGVGRAPDTV